MFKRFVIWVNANSKFIGASFILHLIILLGVSIYSSKLTTYENLKSSYYSVVSLEENLNVRVDKPVDLNVEYDTQYIKVENLETSKVKYLEVNKKVYKNLVKVEPSFIDYQDKDSVYAIPSPKKIVVGSPIPNDADGSKFETYYWGYYFSSVILGLLYLVLLGEGRSYE